MEMMHLETEKVSVIIPTLNAEKEIEVILTQLEKQTLPPMEILVIDSGSNDGTIQTAEKHRLVRTIQIPAASFNHGGTRDLAAKETRGDILLFLTQDAVPADENMISCLVKGLKEPGVAAAYARQIPKENVTPRERYVREFSYPAYGDIHDLDSVQRLGLCAFYLSNACAAYVKDIYISMGGFEKNVRSNEDMLFAARAIREGYKVIYVAEARILHSHNLSLREQYCRNRLQGYELARHRNLLISDSPASVGIAMMKHVTRRLWKEGRIGSWIHFLADCAVRWIGNRAGRGEYLKEQKNMREQNG